MLAQLGVARTVARVLDDGTSQVYQYQYNAFGKIAQVTDPIGRVTTNTYSTNLIDLLVVQQARFVDGSRKITQIAEVVGIEEDGQVRMENIFEFSRLSGARGEVVGEFRATGYMPSDRKSTRLNSSHT